MQHGLLEPGDDAKGTAEERSLAERCGSVR